MSDAPSLSRTLQDRVWPIFSKEKSRLDRIDRWLHWEHDPSHVPLGTPTPEYRELNNRAQAPWLELVVSAVAQSLYVEGYRRADDPEDAAPWEYWQANGLDSRQIAVHRAALGYGLTYVAVLPGLDPVSGNAIPVIRGCSPRRMIAVYDDPCEDEWPELAVKFDVTAMGKYKLNVYDDVNVYSFTCSEGGSDLQPAGPTRYHGTGFVPVVRFANKMDLEGRSPGEVEPYIPMAGRIDQTVFDRLVVQRFASWVVRTIAGMEKVANAGTPEQQKLRMRIEDILIAEDPDTRFGSLPATPLDGFISAHDADIHDLAAITQTPPHYLLGDMVNISAEGLAAAEMTSTRKRIERQHSFGESWEQVLRLGALQMGEIDAAQDMEAQVRWRDMESRSLAQTADALGKIAQMLGVPVEMLWEKIPGWTQQDVERAKALAQAQGGIELLTKQLLQGETSLPPGTIDPGLTKTGTPAEVPVTP
jgi:hypothetical protein